MAYFTLSELNPHNYPLSPEVEANLLELIKRISLIRKAYGKSLRVNSGLRSQEDQQRINPSAPKSKHLTGHAVDIASDKEFHAFILNNVKLLEESSLWCEDLGHTKTWVHFQSLPPKSKKRFFIP